MARNLGAMLTLDTSLLDDCISPAQLRALQDRVDSVRSSLFQHTCPGNQFLGWLDLPSKSFTDEMKAIQECAAEIRSQADCLVVIGIGGSYLGARAIIEGLSAAFPKEDKELEILYFGHHLSADYAAELLHYLKTKKYYINVISKSGTTTEPGAAFRILRDHLARQVTSDELAKRIIATTDAKNGGLRKMAEEEGYRTFIIPDDVGGRFSVLTPAGLLPIAAAGLDLNALMQGARDMAEKCRQEGDIFTNPALTYAAARHLLYQNGKTIEVLAVFEPYLHYFTEWWKQLYGESEGKDGKGIFPASVVMTTDLHSMGQYLQEGRRELFETFIIADESHSQVLLPELEADADGMNYLAHKDLSYINLQAYHGTAAAHQSGGLPNMTIHVPRRAAYWLGQLVYFFEFAVAVSGLLLEVNPFTQSGVEAYKNNMFKLLGKKANKPQP